MTRNRCLLFGALGALAVGMLCLAPAAAADQGVEINQDGKYCAILVGKAPEGNASPVLAKACSDVSMGQAEAAMNAQNVARKRAQGATAVAGIPIAYWYENVDYNHWGRDNVGFSTIYGDDGPCDAAGYRLNTGWWWGTHVSSIAGNNDCNTARVFNLAENDAENFSTCVGCRGHYLERFNDNVGHFQVYRS